MKKQIGNYKNLNRSSETLMSRFLENHCDYLAVKFVRDLIAEFLSFANSGKLKTEICPIRSVHS